MNSILLGVSGSVACYKALEIVRLLRQSENVRVCLTSTAAQMVTPTLFRAVSGQPVLYDEWQTPVSDDGMDHIAAARDSKALLVAPASADFIARAAYGAANDLLSATFLAASCRRLIAPAMNQQMWQAAATQRNIRQLAADGVTVLGPATGVQACGEYGPGRLLDPVDIVKQLLHAPLRGQKIVVNTGATVVALDDMRVISNRSSGRMGFCLAEAAYSLGADVTLISAQTTLSPPSHLRTIYAPDNDAMRQAVLAEVHDADWFFAAAAVADFRLQAPINGKLARENGSIQLSLCPTDDILAKAAQRPGLRCLGFAAQHGNVHYHATGSTR